MSVTLWLRAAVLFMVPLAIAVAALSVKDPGAGGFYLWTRNDFGPWPGFLCFIDTMRAAYQALVSLMVINGFFPYLYIFGSAWKAGKRVSAVSGTAITGLAIFCSVVPTAEVGNVWLFETKLAIGTGAIVFTVPGSASSNAKEIV
jgi:hypothetical protein